MVPVWSITNNKVIVGDDGLRPISFSMTITCAELEIGRSSASPCTNCNTGLMARHPARSVTIEQPKKLCPISKANSEVGYNAAGGKSSLCQARALFYTFVEAYLHPCLCPIESLTLSDAR
jgi:hypothetical protein